jgi:Raf kinase inhibitor-like YbhB/YbcL family protein
MSARFTCFGVAVLGALEILRLPGCGAAEPTAKSKGTLPMTIKITSTAFADNQPIPRKFTGEGVDVSPPLVWSKAPQGTKEWALICDDPDAPTPRPWVHWVIYKIPVDTTSLPEGVPRDARLKSPLGAVQGKNSWPDGENLGYRGPMPPPGHGTHHYHFRIYALDTILSAVPGAEKETLLREMDGHILTEGRLTGTYKR